VTPALQQGTITHRNKSYTLVDSPGFFDTTRSGVSNDGPNLCKLVKALESCAQIVSVVFVYTDRFSTPHKMWFDRMRDLLSDAHKGHIVLLHNKLGPIDVETKAENNLEIRGLLGSRQEYIWFSFNADRSMTDGLLNVVTNFAPFQLSNLTIPEICYEKTVEGAPYDEELVNNRKDEGHSVEEVKDTSHYETTMVADNSNLIGIIFGSKIPVKNWVEGTAKETRWVQNEVTKRIVATYVDIYKVRFDNTKDLVQKKEVSRREEVY
jgi:hypothetical protein